MLLTFATFYCWLFSSCATQNVFSMTHTNLRLHKRGRGDEEEGRITAVEFQLN